MWYREVNDGESVELVDMYEAARCHDSLWRTRTTTGDADVSTVFLGLDHGGGLGGPVLYETMVFGGELDGEQERYRTRAEALAGHAAMVARVDAVEAAAAGDDGRESGGEGG